MTALPRAAERIKTKAEENGWTVVPQYASTSVALRLYRSALRGADAPRTAPERVVALWVDGRFDGAWQGWKPEPPHGGVSPRRLSSRELITVVTS